MASQPPRSGRLCDIAAFFTWDLSVDVAGLDGRRNLEALRSLLQLFIVGCDLLYGFVASTTESVDAKDERKWCRHRDCKMHRKRVTVSAVSITERQPVCRS